jgi:predicted Na+-dependent transporter
LNRVSMLAGVIWTPLVGWLIWKLPGGGEPRQSTSMFQLAIVSLLYPVYYLAVSWVITGLHWRRHAGHRRQRV